MKKFVLLAALVCGASFAGNATTLKAAHVAVVKKSAVSAKVITPTHITLLYEMEFTCPKQGWSIPVVGYTISEMANTYMYYQTHLDC